MNKKHLQLCSSAEWGKHVRYTLLPWVLQDANLGDHMLEVGPGPGLTTDLLRKHVRRLTAVEIDPKLARKLAKRMAGTNVEVVGMDATKLPFDDNTFSAAACFTMLHHVPTKALQDKLLREIARVLRPGGVLVGVDSLDSPAFRKLHRDDICNPIDPLRLPDRLRRAGFISVNVTVWSVGTRFQARKPRRKKLH